MSATSSPIKFGTDGWRGVIADEFTFDRVRWVAPRVAQVLARTYGESSSRPLVIVGYDRRFLAEEFARAVAETVQAAGFDVLLSSDYAPTPAFSWAAKTRGALGAIVLTASHNPAQYLGLKIKGAFGGSVSKQVTQEVEALLDRELETTSQPGTLEMFDPWESYCQGLREVVPVEPIAAAIASGKLAVFADVMHGAAASGLQRLLGVEIGELHGERDPLFGGRPPEPLARYIPELFRAIGEAAREKPEQLRVGLVFDGDCDRIAAVDGSQNFLSSQVLVPILLDHLVTRRSGSGEVVKTLSGSDIIPRLAEQYGLPVFETPIGYKYIADRMQEAQVLVGGEESGGIGYGMHIPERDALLSALLVLETVVESGQNLGEIFAQLQAKTEFYSVYDRVDLPLASLEVKERLQATLKTQPLTQIDGRSVVECQTTDGFKFRLEDGSWLLIRFSGTEPVLRLYCEALTPLQVRQTLDWAKNWATP